MRLKMIHPTFLQTSFLPFYEKDIKHFILKAGNESGKAFGSILYLLNYVFGSVITEVKDKETSLCQFIVLCPYKARADRI